MKQICVISGKGGTGKSSITASLAQVSGTNVVIADCDVDGANSALFFKGVDTDRQFHISGTRASIQNDLCTRCGHCIKVCRFGAIDRFSHSFSVNSVACEGCHSCAVVCPEDAIHFLENVAGVVYKRTIETGTLVHAKLYPAQDNSGKLVTRVRDWAQKVAVEQAVKQIWIDGPPGIGCAVHAAVSGVNTVIIVTEPSVSGIHDLKRVLQLCVHFGLSAHILINKFDLHLDQTSRIEQFAFEHGVGVVGKIAFDKNIPLAQCQRKTLYQMNTHRDNLISIYNKIQIQLSK